MPQSVAHVSRDVNPARPRGTNSPLFPITVIPGAIELDEGFDLKTRVLVAIQQHYGATFTEWTPPLPVRTIAEYFGRSVLTISRVLKHLVSHGYIMRDFVSRPGHVGCYQYKLPAPWPEWLGGE